MLQRCGLEERKQINGRKLGGNYAAMQQYTKHNAWDMKETLRGITMRDCSSRKQRSKRVYGGRRQSPQKPPRQPSSRREKLEKESAEKDGEWDELNDDGVKECDGLRRDMLSSFRIRLRSREASFLRSLWRFCFSTWASSFMEEQ